MNNSQKGKAFERWDRDGVAQHRNLMHEIAMKKQISMYQREEKILEKELREISKVKETLLQIQAPLRRRVRAAEVEESFQSPAGTERNLRKTSVTTRKISVAETSAQQSCTKDSKATQEMETCDLRDKKLPATFSGENSPLSPTQNIPQRKISVLERGQLGVTGRHRLAQRKVSAPAFIAGKKPISVESGKSGFLPVIQTPNLPPDCSPSVKRKSPLLGGRPMSAGKNDVLSPIRAPVAPSKVDMAVFRAKSVPCELPSYLVSTSKSRQRQISDTDEVTTLTMEETLRIKGKFRQIGHSVIATALLKGLKQNGQLSSEAIHNMHKPIFLGEENDTNNEENKDEDVRGETKEQGQEEEEIKQGNNKKSFTNLARKTININRLINAKSSTRRRSRSDPEKFSSTATMAATLRLKSVSNATGKNLEKVADKEMINNCAQSGNSRDIQVTAAIQQGTNGSLEDTESEKNLPTQQFYRKQSTDVDPFRPLMNPRTAHARRRKNTFNMETMKEFFEKTQNYSGVTEPQVTQTDIQNTGQKTVRFVTDAWSQN